MSDTTVPETKKLFTFSSGGWVLLLSFVLTLLAAALVLWPLYQTGFVRSVGDGRNVDTYGFDLSNLKIPRATLVASGASKDQIRSIPVSLVETITVPEVVLKNQNDRERGRFLVSSDRVVGVEINGETRAYPLRVMSFHEVVNDVVGGVPVGVTYSPLSDSVVVFDRRIDEGAAGVEFGVSGLLADSTSVLFDRRKTMKEESLWPQLELGAVSGPAAGKRWTLVPHAVTTWKRWMDAHPETRVVVGMRTMTGKYKSEPFNTYLASDELKFPVEPLWRREGVPVKTRISVVSTDGGKRWRAELVPAAGGTETVAPTTGPASEIRLYTFVFAWYAQHADDTDYSALGR